MEEIIDEEFFLNELLSDSEKENKTKNSKYKRTVWF